MGDPYHIVRIRTLRRSSIEWLKQKLAWYEERAAEIKMVLKELDQKQKD